MRSFYVKIMGLVLMSALISSCATTSLVDTWRNPELAIQRHHKLLLVYISKNEATSRLYEDVLAGELNQKGVETVAGYTLFPELKKINGQTMTKGVHESGADAMLTMQTIRVEKHFNVQPGYEDVYPDYWYPGAFPRWDMYGYFDGYHYYEPPTITTYEIAEIQVNLFDAQSGKLLWAATIKTSEPGNTVSVSKELAAIVVRTLSREGLI